MVALQNFAPPDGDPKRAPRSLRILLADDDRDMVMTLSAILLDEGHVVSHAYTGREALQAARRYKPEVCLLDISMPGMSGYDLARKLRLEFGNDIVLVAISGVYKAGPDRILAEIAGFNHHLGKPFEPSELLRILEAAGSTPGRR